jgi:hypothetical protein
MGAIHLHTSSLDTKMMHFFLYIEADLSSGTHFLLAW